MRTFASTLTSNLQQTTDRDLHTCHLLIFRKNEIVSIWLILVGMAEDYLQNSSFTKFTTQLKQKRAKNCCQYVVSDTERVWQLESVFFLYRISKFKIIKSSLLLPMRVIISCLVENIFNFIIELFHSIWFVVQA